ncbi:MAG: hypothetical protein M1825_006238 [Sarcosagium campestre]|nr:MAG: hypothetical protein M1825_006238 [Sarcosagium campestre]
MAEETEVEWRSLMANENCLKPEAPKGKSVRAWGDFQDAELTRAACRVNQNATPKTRPYFVRGPNHKGEHHWVALWCLYHLFRYRDDRNRNRKPPSAKRQLSGKRNVPVARHAATAQQAVAVSPNPGLLQGLPTPPPSSSYYDENDGNYELSRPIQGTITPHSFTLTYDPVRDT